MNQVEGICHSRSISSSRRAPTTPNSPRDMALGEVAWKFPIHTEMASKSNVRQTLTFLPMASLLVDLAEADQPGARAPALVFGISTGHLYCAGRESVQPHTDIVRQICRRLAMSLYHYVRSAFAA